MGCDPDGLVPEAVRYEMLNREAAAAEAAVPRELPGASKVRKLPLEE
jgi:hypothetical protein